MEFVNEYSLVVLSDPKKGDPPQLQIFDTEQRKPKRTSLSFPTTFSAAPDLRLSLEPSSHIPSPDELVTAPFYPDDSQRILAVYFGRGSSCYLINTELLLRLARKRKGQGVGWDEWCAHAIEVHVGDPETVSQISASGCRLFCTVSDDMDGPFYLRIYDFSHASRAKYLRAPGEGGGMRWIPLSLDGHKLPGNSPNLCDALLITGHDSLVFQVVSILILLSIRSQLN